MVGILRVKAKVKNWMAPTAYPILLAKDSPFLRLIISDLHVKACHAGIYKLSSILRKQFYIPSIFSTLKKVLKTCTVCARYNSRTIKLNQSPYRGFRIEPPSIPYRYLSLDYIGPLSVKESGKNSKVYLLCITCLWSRAVNLVICRDLTTKSFLRAFQIHVYQWGLPEYCYSDSGSQIVPGSNVITDFLSDSETKIFFEARKIKPLTFDQFPRGCN